MSEPVRLSACEPIGQGTMGLGGYFVRDESRDEAAVAVLRAGIAQGLTFIDTAEAYGGGHSEELVGRAIRDCRGAVTLATKVSPEHLAYDDVLRACEASLARLGTGHIDLYQIHWPNPRIAIEETMRALRKLVADGKVRAVGLSNFSVPEIRAAQRALGDLKIAAVQCEYNLFDRSVEADLLPYCRAQGMTLIAYSPLDVGRIGGDPRLSGLAAAAGLSPAQLALKWVTRRSGVIAIPKAADGAHLAENAAAARAEVPAALLDAVERLFPPTRIEIDPRAVRVDRDGIDRFVPGPEELAMALRAGAPLKPIRVRPLRRAEPYVYELVEGKLRYWAWLAANPAAPPIPALVRQEGQRR